MMVKVCGLRRPEQIEPIADFSDLIGFIFYSKSPRYIDKPANSSNALRVGVFVNEKVEVILDKVKQHKLDFVQLHGQESPEYCLQLKSKVRIIKAFGIDELFDFSQLSNYKDCSDYLLFDTKTESHGGSGKSFDWTLLDKYEDNLPFFISGGINANSLTELKKIEHPQFIGVDLNSGFESSPADKNIDQLRKFIYEIKR